MAASGLCREEKYEPKSKTWDLPVASLIPLFILWLKVTG